MSGLRFGVEEVYLLFLMKKFFLFFLFVGEFCKYLRESRLLGRGFYVGVVF